MFKEDLKKFDHLIIGLIFGLIIPIIIMHFWLGLYLNLSLYDVVRNPFFSEIVNILKGSIFVNLVLFFCFYWFKKDKSARGVVFATLLYGAFYIYYMFFM
jgi:hypothetical protein